MDEVIAIPGGCEHGKPITVEPSADLPRIIMFFQGIPNFCQQLIPAFSSEKRVYKLKVFDIEPDNLKLLFSVLRQTFFYLPVKSLPII
jgi:hypothetical protein